MAKKTTKVEAKTTENAKQEYKEERRNINRVDLLVNGSNFQVKEVGEGDKKSYVLNAEYTKKDGSKVVMGVNQGKYLTTTGKQITLDFDTFYSTDKAKMEKVADALNKAKDGEKFLTLQGYPYFEVKTNKDNEEYLSKSMSFKVATMFASKNQGVFKGFIIEGLAFKRDFETKSGETNGKEWTITNGQMMFFIGKENADTEKDEQYNTRYLNITSLEKIPTSVNGKKVKVLFMPQYKSFEAHGKTFETKLANIIAVGDKQIQEKLEDMGKKDGGEGSAEATTTPEVEKPKADTKVETPADDFDDIEKL